MRKYYSPFLISAIGLLLFLVQGISFSGCTKVNDNLGADFIPDGQGMKVRIDTLETGILSYVTQTDSLVSNYRSSLVFGKTEDPVFGKMTAGTIFQMYPTSTDFNKGNFFGYKPEFDSLYLIMYLADYFGKDEVEQTINIYALKDSLQKDSAYYYNIPVEQVVDFSEPLFSFKTGNESLTSVKLMDNITPSGEKFINKLINLDPEIYKDPYYDFQKIFYGLYMAPADDSPQDAAIYHAYLYESNNVRSYSRFTLFTHNYDPDYSHYVRKDTVDVSYIFEDTYPFPNMTVQKVTREYPSNIQAIINDTINPQSKLYVQGLDGLTTLVRFTDEFVESIEELKVYNGVKYNNLIVSNARLIINVPQRSAYDYNVAPPRLGLYKDYKGFYPTPSDDYMYEYEGSITLPFGGYLNRSNGYYSMDVSVSVSNLLHDPDNATRDLYIAPEVGALTGTYAHVALDGYGSTEPFKLVLTYTLVK